MSSFAENVFSKIRTTIAAIRESGKGFIAIAIEHLINLAELASDASYWRSYHSKKQQIIDALNKETIQLNNQGWE